MIVKTFRRFLFFSSVISSTFSSFLVCSFWRIFSCVFSTFEGFSPIVIRAVRVVSGFIPTRSRDLFICLRPAVQQVSSILGLFAIEFSFSSDSKASLVAWRRWFFPAILVASNS